ncbi:hypothetical protein NQ315_011521, partial [Exocentrus adspersus]
SDNPNLVFIVTVPPDIDDSATSSDITVKEGENVTFTCSATGHPAPRILWRREDGGHLIIQTGSHEIQKVETFRGPTLKLARVERRQMGAYLCIASNDVPPAVSKRITLHITWNKTRANKFPPKVQVQKPLIGAPLHTSTKLKCDVEAFPFSNNYWIKGEEMILKSEKYTILEKKSGYKVVMLLTIHNVTKSDIGTFTCVAQNTMGKSEDSARIYERKMMDEDISENLLFPSYAPAPLEQETIQSSSANPTSAFAHLILTIVVVLPVLR